jgi:hypothetical protein
LCRSSRIFKSGAKEGGMFGCNTEPLLRDALADPIIRTIMNADHVDPRALEASLRETARKVSSRSCKHAANEN